MQTILLIVVSMIPLCFGFWIMRKLDDYFCRYSSSNDAAHSSFCIDNTEFKDE